MRRETVIAEIRRRQKRAREKFERPRELYGPNFTRGQGPLAQWAKQLEFEHEFWNAIAAQLCNE